MPNTFSFLLALMKSAQTWEKWSIISIFCHLCPFPQVFGQVKEWLILELYEMIRVWHIRAWPVVLFCFVILVDKEECSNIWKMVSFKDFRTLWSVSSRIWAVLGADHTVFHKVLRVYFLSFEIEIGREECSKLNVMLKFKGAV